MAKKQTISKAEAAIGERLRAARVDVLAISIREMARLLDTAPIHVSDIENGKRNPSDELLMKMATAYRLPEAMLRAGFARPESVVAEVASESEVAAEKVPEFLRTARGLNSEQWDKLIRQAKSLKSDKGT